MNWARRLLFLILVGGAVTAVSCTNQTESTANRATEPIATTTPEPIPVVAESGELVVNAALHEGPINPLVYGTNYGPWIAVPPGVMEEFQSSGLTFLRFPGGNWGDINTIRPYQIDLLMQLADMINAEVSISVNIFEGTVDDALELMRYVNEEKGYNVKHWSIGNEPTLYQTNREAPEWDTAYYNEKWREFATAMKAADPEIILNGPDLHQYTAVEANNPKDDQGRDWMREFLKANGDLVDVVTIHRYPFPNTRLDPNPDFEDLRNNSPEWDEIIPTLRHVMQEELGEQKPIGIMEVNSNWTAAAGTETTPDSHLNAIWWADSLGRIIENDVDMVAHFALQNNISGWGMLARNEPRPTYFVYKLHQLFGSEKLQEDSAVDLVSIYSAKREDGTVTILIINRGDDAQSVPLTVENFTPSAIEQWLFDQEHNAENLGIIDWENGDTVDLSGLSVTLLIMSP